MPTASSKPTDSIAPTQRMGGGAGMGGGRSAAKPGGGADSGWATRGASVFTLPDDVPPHMTSPAPLEIADLQKQRPAPPPSWWQRMKPELGLSLFWRTFLLLALLLASSILAWLQTLRALESEPRAVRSAQQVASLVNLSRAALAATDAIGRVSVIKTLADQEGMRISVREPGDTTTPLPPDALAQRLGQALTQRIGPGTEVVGSVNQRPGLWVGFSVLSDRYWLQLDRSRFEAAGGPTWAVWMGVAVALSLAGAALIARRINRPLKRLSFAASRLREGDYSASQLDEDSGTSEIREVNIGFNRMAQRLAAMEQDRAVMLAGISHDLRTPLARLRLETEMSVPDAEARTHMAADIAQLDAIIDKFLDYARPGSQQLRPVSLRQVIDNCLFPLQGRDDLAVALNLPPAGPHGDELVVMADEVELGRVITNLLENARRYGKSPGTVTAYVDIAAKLRDPWVLIKVRDHGPGVDEAVLPHLTQPFYRADDARTAATGAGLGLAIVERTMVRMGGAFGLSNTRSGGLAAHLQLRRAVTK